jgi:hypothetical protein
MRMTLILNINILSNRSIRSFWVEMYETDRSIEM